MLKKLLAIAVLSLGVYPTVLAQDLIESLENIVTENSENNFFEGTVLVAKNGEVLYQRSIGFKDYNKSEEIENDSKFGIASITKMITSILILQLHQEGKLGLDQSMDELLPELNLPAAKKITVHHLLLHISGLPNERDQIYLRELSPQDFISETLKNGRKSRGFGKFNYANIDYILLGLIAEKIEDQSWQKLVENRFFEPLKMADSGFLRKEEFPDDFVYTFSIDESGKRIQDPDFHIENFFSAGSMYSTASDLLNLDQALYTDKLLNEESKKKFYRSYPEYNYTGYGVWTYSYPYAENSPLIMERRGGILGSNSTLVRLLESNQTLIILSNNDRFDTDTFGNPENLKEAIIKFLAKSNDAEKVETIRKF
ncbi:serine hydrolase domain-containing protein [Algoriphagus formosus]|uniref:serine hydrolase domain-containing protein n=1 Tax=Algoriphagus formosus TaxID=2007308 RepID=UPI003F6E7736